MIFAGILAGGIGSRIKSSKIPKQFIETCGVPLLVYTIRAFLGVESIDKIIVSTNKEHKEEYLSIFKSHLTEEQLEKIVFVNGGSTRFYSLINIANKAKELAGGKKAILVSHDGARPFIDTETIKANIVKKKEYDAVTSVIPLTDTLVKSESDIALKYIERENLFQNHTPQTFDVDEFLTLAESLNESEKESYIEIVRLYLNNNKTVGTVQGGWYNFKITNDIDLQYSEFLLKNKYIQI